MTVIPLGPPLPTGSSRLPADSASSVVVRLFGVAPDGGCRVSPAPREGSDSSLWPCSSLSLRPRGRGYCGRALPGILLCGARTFLSPGNDPRGSDDLASFAAPLYDGAVVIAAQTLSNDALPSHDSFMRAGVRGFVAQYRPLGK